MRGECNGRGLDPVVGGEGGGEPVLGWMRGIIGLKVCCKDTPLL